MFELKKSTIHLNILFFLLCTQEELTTHLELLQLVPPMLKEALECGRLRSNRPSLSLRLRLDMVLTCFFERHTADEYSELQKGKWKKRGRSCTYFKTHLHAH